MIMSPELDEVTEIVKKVFEEITYKLKDVERIFANIQYNVYTQFNKDNETSPSIILEQSSRFEQMLRIFIEQHTDCYNDLNDEVNKL